MSEQQLRDVLARVVPDAPDSAADAAPVVRVARRRRRALRAGTGGLVAVALVGLALGIRVLQDEPRVVADPPPASIPDPYTSLPCPELGDELVNSPVPDPESVTAVRFCGRDMEDALTVHGPSDALVTHLGDFAREVAATETADPGRCAATSPPPAGVVTGPASAGNQLLLRLDDGTDLLIPTELCQDVEIGGRAVDASTVTRAWLKALRAQRDEYDYTAPTRDDPADCDLSAWFSPALPGHEGIASGLFCPVDGTDPSPLSETAVAQLDAAWAAAYTSKDNGCEPSTEALPWLVVTTDRGDVMRLDPDGCGTLVTPKTTSPRGWMLDADIDELGGG